MDKADGSKVRPFWFVGAMWEEDQIDRFLSEGVWENGYEDKLLDEVRSIRPGDRIAIKAAYTRKRNLPFDNRGQTVSVMAIKAIGSVTENLGDGRKVRVKWTRFDSPREWYFFTHRGTIWRVLPGEWREDALIAFAFDGKQQDLDRFRNAPYWKERFGDTAVDKRRFQWTQFYEAIANKLLDYRHDRAALVTGIHEISKRVKGLTHLQDHFKDGTSGPVKDICPFTTFGIFNRGITDSNRKTIAVELANFLKVKEPVPVSFEGIPVLNNMNSWFFSFDKNRQSGDIDSLWEVFAAAIGFVESEDVESKSAFMKAFDNANGRQFVGWNLTCGLYWIRPWSFLSLDGKSRSYISKKLSAQIGLNGPKKRCNAADFLSAIDSFEARFQEEAYPVHSFPELSLAAWLYKDSEGIPPQPDDADLGTPGEEGEKDSATQPTPAPIEPYSVDDILEDGCFLERNVLERLLERLRTKKNLIIQGPPGTGKTWLGKRLGFALMGQRDDSRLKALQFHPNLSYEDFVRGWRPSGEGKLSLIDGPFMEAIKAALKEPSAKFVVVIEEINRGNPAQIFGEMLTLLEADKRTPSEALELSYRRNDGERIFIPANLYVIGTMNIADRSLALVDFALRRRFAFVELEPIFGKTWKEWVGTKCGIGSELLNEMEKRILALNSTIAADSSLGRQFCIGHSFVTPPFETPIADGREWFKQVVETEIGPLLDEYWFDASDKSQMARKKLLEGF